MNVPITPGTLLQDRFFVLRVLRPVEFGWLYRAVDQKTNGAVCLLEEFIIPDDVADRAAIIQQKFTLAMQPFQRLDLPPDVAIALPSFSGTIAEQNRVFMVHTWGDHASYDQVLEDRMISGDGPAVLEELEAIELLDGLEPLVRALAREGLHHGYLCRDTIVWQDGYDVPGLMHFGGIRSIAMQYELEPIHEIASVDDRQTDLQQLATTVLDLLGDRPWNRISIQLANRLRLLLEPEQRSQLRSQALQPSLPRAAGWAAQIPAAAPRAQPNPPLQPNPPSYPAPRWHRLLEQESPRRRLKKRSPLQKTIALIQHWKHHCQTDPTLGLLALITIGLCGLLSYRLIFTRVSSPSILPSIATSPGFSLPNSLPSESPLPNTALPPDIETQLRSLNLSSDWFSATVTELNGDPIGTSNNQRWIDRANQLIKTLETLSPETRRELGTYRRANLDAWLTTLQTPTQKLDIITKQIEDATDAEFFKAFPDRKGTALNPRNLGQVWYAIARAEIAKLKRS